jgi:hypothetical protein
MTPFEYVTVLISIILGLGITQIVTGIADIIHTWDRNKLYWPHLLWIVLVFFLHIYEWWTIYNLRQYESWRLPTFLFITLYPINLFVLARILFPLHYGEVTSFDFKPFYFSNYRKFFLSIIILNVLGILDNVFVTGSQFSDQVIQLIILGVLTPLVIKKTDKEWIHQLIVVALVAFMAVSLVITWDQWLLM